MKTIHVETKYQGQIKLPSELVKKLPKKIVLATTAQYLNFLTDIKEQLHGKETILYNSKHGKHPGQILGCDDYKFGGAVEAFLYIGDGLFHPQALMLANEKPVFRYNPLAETWQELSKKDVERIKIKKRVALSRFYTAKKIGIIVTVKPGQRHVQIKDVAELKEKYPDKEFFEFVSDNIDLNDLENFNFIEMWVNTACPRLVEDNSEKGMINVRDVLIDK